MTKHHKSAGISKSPKGTMPEKSKSAPLPVAVGSGARPHKSTHKIETSAPMHAHKLGRAPSGALK